MTRRPAPALMHTVAHVRVMHFEFDTTYQVASRCGVVIMLPHSLFPPTGRCIPSSSPPDLNSMLILCRAGLTEQIAYHICGLNFRTRLAFEYNSRSVIDTENDRSRVTW